MRRAVSTLSFAAALCAALFPRISYAQEEPSTDDGAALETEVAAVAASEETESAPSQPVPEAPEERAKFVGALEGKPGFDVGASLAAAWILRDAPERPSNELRVSRARAELSWSRWKLVEAKVSAELMEVFEGQGASLLRDLYIRVQPLSWLGLRAGQFKKPFSRMELWGRSKFPLVDRGVANDFVIDQLKYGGRDVGAQLEGRIVDSIELDYAIGVFNGLGANELEKGLDGKKDFVARLEAKPAKWLGLGASGSLKLVEKSGLTGFVDEGDFGDVVEDEYPLGYGRGDFEREHLWMTGAHWMAEADVSLKLGDLRAAVEAGIGENWWFEKYPHTVYGALVASYKLRVKAGVPVWIEPVVRAETLAFFTDGFDKYRVRLFAVAPGVNLHLGKHVRLMIDGEFVIADGDEADIDGSRRSGLWPNEYAGDFTDSKKLTVQLGFSV